MVVHSFYIFNKWASSCQCIHSQRWQHYQQPAKDLSEEEEQKLIFGVVFSLRGLVRKIAGNDDEHFQTFKTSQYKLHIHETASNLKFILITDRDSPNLTKYLELIYAGPYNSAVVRNPLVNMTDERVTNENLRKGVEYIVKSIK
ncbi:snare-like protein [Wallemia mellicola]|uniref:Trafficking protein particle complex subunit n=1 Tax=Wallemia mellicola TaxID=1708541 RepID=A0A4T0N328_9BASI|nr:hypothetical protein E3Q24_01253 [Wallemia mellicola]TIB82083.1 snare-like protein [Wallemia mellicola]TIB87714.1 snare-like protein [Wallemia mellicola]TIB90631.1 snare-like protein [Wallemia mellicola]TIC05555.1 snare-like protein [Wallemia mellicola]